MGRGIALSTSPARPPAAILTLNTISHTVGTVGAIGVGNQAAAIWSDSNPD